jgi:uncharacterized Zn finger protein
MVRVRKRRVKPQHCAGIRTKVEFDDPRWWTAEWLRYIDGISDTKRIRAAKNYARSGRVIDINVSPGLVDARVQGRRKLPYHVRIYSPPPSCEQVRMIERGLTERAVFAARLLSGEMPEEIKEIYASSGAALMPDGFERHKRLCSCPEQVEDCKHILAVLLVLADVFDRDPFPLLRMRGMEKDRLVTCLTSPRGWLDQDAGDGEPCGAYIPDYGDEAETPLREEPPGGVRPLAADASFYGAERLSAELQRLSPEASEPGDIPGHMPSLFDFPMWRGEISFKDLIYPYYEIVRRFLRPK